MPVAVVSPRSGSRVALRALPPLSLYVHLPWCVRKCPYCDFNSHEVRGELPFEFMMNALRLTEGFEVGTFADRTGLPITVAEKALAAAEAKGLIARDHLRICPTLLGRRFLNDLLQLFLPEDFRR